MSEAKATAKWSDAERAIRVAIGCMTPLPTRCKLCNAYNRGLGLDYCLFSNWKNTLNAHDSLLARNKRLKRLFEETSNRKYADGSCCWCGNPPALSSAVHGSYCTQGRAALAEDKEQTHE